jgi:hypothetical protein
VNRWRRLGALAERPEHVIEPLDAHRLWRQVPERCKLHRLVPNDRMTGIADGLVQQLA